MMLKNFIKFGFTKRAFKSVVAIVHGMPEAEADVKRAEAEKKRAEVVQKLASAEISLAKAATERAKKFGQDVTNLDKLAKVLRGVGYSDDKIREVIEKGKLLEAICVVVELEKRGRIKLPGTQMDEPSE